MPLSKDDIVRAMAAAAYRREGMLVAGVREDFERGYRLAVADDEWDLGTFYTVDALRPEDAIRNLFDDLLKDGYIEAADFQPQVAKLPLYKLHSRTDPRTVQWLDQFRSTKFLRIKYPEVYPDLPEDGGVVWEFAVKAHGGPDSATSVVRSIGEGLHW